MTHESKKPKHPAKHPHETHKAHKSPEHEAPEQLPEIALTADEFEQYGVIDPKSPSVDAFLEAQGLKANQSVIVHVEGRDEPYIVTTEKKDFFTVLRAETAALRQNLVSEAPVIVPEADLDRAATELAMSMVEESSQHHESLREKESFLDDVGEAAVEADKEFILVRVQDLAKQLDRKASQFAEQFKYDNEADPYHTQMVFLYQRMDGLYQRAANGNYPLEEIDSELRSVETVLDGLALSPTETFSSNEVRDFDANVLEPAPRDKQLGALKTEVAQLVTEMDGANANFHHYRQLVGGAISTIQETRRLLGQPGYIIALENAANDLRRLAKEDGPDDDMRKSTQMVLHHLNEIVKIAAS